MCMPNLVDGETGNSNHKSQELLSLHQYSDQLQEIIRTFASVGTVCDISQDDDDQLMTMLTMG